MRKIIHTSLTTIGSWTEIVATCEDGSAWRVARHEDIRIRHDDRRMPENWTKWEKLPDIPSDSDKGNKANTSIHNNCSCNSFFSQKPKDFNWNV